MAYFLLNVSLSLHVVPCLLRCFSGGVLGWFLVCYVCGCAWGVLSLVGSRFASWSFLLSFLLHLLCLLFSSAYVQVKGFLLTPSRRCVDLWLMGRSCGPLCSSGFYCMCLYKPVLGKYSSRNYHLVVPLILHVCYWCLERRAVRISVLLYLCGIFPKALTGKRLYHCRFWMPPFTV